MLSKIKQVHGWDAVKWSLVVGFCMLVALIMTLHVIRSIKEMMIPGKIAALKAEHRGYPIDPKTAMEITFDVLGDETPTCDEYYLVRHGKAWTDNVLSPCGEDAVRFYENKILWYLRGESISPWTNFHHTGSCRPISLFLRLKIPEDQWELAWEQGVEQSIWQFVMGHGTQEQIEKSIRWDLHKRGLADIKALEELYFATRLLIKNPHPSARKPGVYETEAYLKLMEWASKEQLVERPDPIALQVELPSGCEDAPLATWLKAMNDAKRLLWDTASSCRPESFDTQPFSDRLDTWLAKKVRECKQVMSDANLDFAGQIVSHDPRLIAEIDLARARIAFANDPTPQNEAWLGSASEYLKDMK